MDLKAPVNKIIPFSSVDGFGNRTAVFSSGLQSELSLLPQSGDHPYVQKLRGMCKHMSRRRAYDGKRKGLL